jgi:hypothetical protein
MPNLILNLARAVLLCLQAALRRRRHHSTRSVSYCTGLSLRQPPSGAPQNVTWESEITYTRASRLPPTRRHLTRQNTARGGSSRHRRASTAQHIVSTSRGACQKALRWKLLAGVPLRARKRVSWRHKLLILQFGVTYRERVRGIRLNHPPLGMGDSAHTLRVLAGTPGLANARGSQHRAQPQGRRI